MTTPNTTELPKTRNIPVWLAVLLILACAGGGGYLAYRFLLGGNNDKIVLLGRSADEIIHEGRAPNTWWMMTTHGGDADGQISFDTNKPGAPQMHYVIIRHDLTHDQNVLVYLDGRARWASSLHLTKDQLAKLAKIPSAHVDLPKPTISAIQDSFAQWVNLPVGQAKERLENKLFTLLEDGTKAQDADSRSAALTRVESVRGILTPDQLKEVRTIRLPWRG